MADTVVTVRPVGGYAQSGTPTFPGGGTFATAMSDDNDATYLNQGQYVDSIVYFAGIVLPAAALIRSVTPRLRWSGSSQVESPSRYLYQQLRLTGEAGYPDNFLAFSQSVAFTIGTSSGIPRTQRPWGGAWTPPDLAANNSLFVELTGVAAQYFFNSYRIYEAYLDIAFNLPPVIQTIGPVGRSIADAVTTAGSTTLTSASAQFVASDAGTSIVSTSSVNAVYADGVTTVGSPTVTSATAAFTADDVGRPLSGAGIPVGTTIASVNSATSVNISINATASASAVSLTITGRMVLPTGTTIASVTNGTTVVLSAAAKVTTTLLNVGIGAGIATTNRPAFSWNYLDPEGDTQERFWVRVFPLTTVQAGGFSPDTSTPYLDSGEVYSSATNWVTPTTAQFPQNISYVAYVKAADAGSGGRYSAWAAGPVFSIAPSAGLLFDLPATPSVVPTADSVNNRVALAVAGIDNELTRNQSSLESSIAGWTAVTNVAAGYPQRQTTAGGFLHGTAAGIIRSAAAGTMTIRSVSAITLAALQLEAVKVLPGQVRTALCSFKSVSVAGRTATLTVAYYNAAGTIIGSATTGTAITILSGSWTQAAVQATVPALAVYEVLSLNVLGAIAASEDIYFDEVDSGPGTSLLWTRGGFVQNQGALADTFTRANSASTLGASEGTTTPAWTALGATWGISSNRAYVASVTNTGVAVLASPALADGTLTCDITLSPTTDRANAGVVLRCIDVSNYLSVVFIKTAAGGNVVNLYKTVGSVATLLGTYSPAGLVNGATYGVKVEFLGGLIRVYLDRKDGAGYTKILDVQLVAADIATFAAATATKYGLYQFNNATNDDGGSRYDNFAINNGDTQLAVVQRSIDGGVTWATVRTANRVDLTDPGQVGTFYDYEAPRGIPVQYRAAARATESDQTFLSGYSAVLAMSPNLANDGQSWLKSPIDPSKNLAVALVKDSANSSSTEDQVVFAPLGRADYLIHGGTVRLEVFDGLEFLFTTDAAYQAFETLRKLQQPLLLQTCYGDPTSGAPEEFWVRLGPARTTTRLTMTTAPGQLRRVKIPAHQVLSPVVV